MKTKTLLLATLCGGVLAAQAASAPYGWGRNLLGQLGDGTSTDRHTPVATNLSGVLSGKTVQSLATSCFAAHVLAITTDGKVYGWGENVTSQLGNGTSTPYEVNPVAVDMTGALFGKTVIAAAAGFNHSLVLTADGLLFAWGDNTNGQLGDSTTTDRTTPVAVVMSGVLAGKTIVQLAAGENFSAVLDSNGVVYTWGSNNGGRLGDGTTTDRHEPVAVSSSGVLSGKVISLISIGKAHTLALDSAGAVYAWGNNGAGQLGDGTNTDRHAPVAVDTTGVLATKSIAHISAGMDHSLAASTDGHAYSWGLDQFGALGDVAAGTSAPSPIIVFAGGALYGKTVTAVAAGVYNGHVLTADGELYGWGYNLQGQVGDGTTTERQTAAAVDMTGTLSGQAVTKLHAGYFSCVVLAAPVVSTITPAARFTYAANFGWLNWRTNPLATDTPVIEATMLHGKVYSANVGWIDLGDGTPAGTGSQYTQTGGDIGVNHDGAGGLSGYAYGANIGWITFDPSIATPPRVDITTGAFSGYAYSANCGWIHLGSLYTRMNPGVDTETLAGGGTGDGIADAWEQEQAQNAGITPNLANLGFSPNSDYDGDGVSDFLEYLADSNPYSAGSQLKITDFTHNPSTGEIDLGWNSSARRIYKVFCSSDLLTWTQVGTTQAGGTSSLQLTGPAATHLFFRVETLLPLSE